MTTTKRARYEMIMPAYLKEAAQRRADSKNIPLAEYIKDLIKIDLAKAKKKH